ncbi:hypothetical protein [uncultured Tateyamaria sp.]|uniref:hypothetical protein n=1 Tax=uncultured Tateyamaria sp. TaxID=455651 RepID=UPI00263451E2|nr:hypothetical protein [uncultured Tateyamaria sp.]
MTISVPPPDKAIKTNVVNAPALKKIKARTNAKTTGILRRLTIESAKIANGMRGKTATDHSNQVAFGSDGSVKGTGTKPNPMIAAPKSAAYL